MTPQWQTHSIQVPFGQPCNKSTQHRHSATHYCTQSVWEAHREREGYNDIKGQSGDSSADLQTMQPPPPRKVIWESDCFLEIVFHFTVMELWEVADSCFNFHCRSASVPEGPGGNQWLTDFSMPTTGYDLTQWGDQLQPNTLQLVANTNTSGFKGMQNELHATLAQ